ncbi:hypothetical protein CHS0354_019881 [Potamilus streckersoni]|uniref:Uncharacterized protein n=1 Tax=Potamilus streckersoni TaxID=2493646 RepID=A0AAE0VY49_9BIVA|nr:hypothetical protein CHS0354_019881 [Potamilus streckersoni]
MLRKVGVRLFLRLIQKVVLRKNTKHGRPVGSAQKPIWKPFILHKEKDETIRKVHDFSMKNTRVNFI